MNGKDRGIHDHRVCFKGDSFIHGTGDSSRLGWVGRVTANMKENGWEVTTYNLGVRGDSSREVLFRWEQECLHRFVEGTRNVVVFSSGVNDVMMENGLTRIPRTESQENFQKIMEKAQSLYHTFVVGPPPIQDSCHNIRIHELSRSFEKSAAAKQVPYFSTFEALSQTIRMDEVRKGDRTHPGQAGYAQLVKSILEWSDWPFPQT